MVALGWGFGFIGGEYWSTSASFTRDVSNKRPNKHAFSATPGVRCGRYSICRRVTVSICHRHVNQIPLSNNLYRVWLSLLTVEAYGERSREDFPYNLCKMVARFPWGPPPSLHKGSSELPKVLTVHWTSRLNKNFLGQNAWPWSVRYVLVSPLRYPGSDDPRVDTIVFLDYALIAVRGHAFGNLLNIERHIWNRWSFFFCSCHDTIKVPLIFLCW